MKKLKLKALEFNAEQVLTREQLKNILGGDGGSGNCTCTCTGGKFSGDSWTYDNGSQPPGHIQQNDVDSYCGVVAGVTASCTGCTNPNW
ncbi:MAG: TIGR04149 family rSAM-modified RiPP [Bacteroidetes bacterium]|nr:TIGR04149 family rSAM-modified RiPP [Bacteroidota bacterium]